MKPLATLAIIALLATIAVLVSPQYVEWRADKKESARAADQVKTRQALRVITDSNREAEQGDASARARIREALKTLGMDPTQTERDWQSVDRMRSTSPQR